MSELLMKRLSGEKDRVEKYLEAYPDVFADVANALIIGKTVIRPEDLKDGPTESVYKAECRVMGYDYASYRGQIDAGKHRFPVITGVLYYGDRPWNGPCTIGEAVEVPEEYKKIFSDYRIHVIDVPRLSEEVRAKLTSDFRVVADYFAGRMKEDYVPIDQPLKHPEAVLDFLWVFTGDERYEQIEEEFAARSRKGEAIRMCEVLDRAERKGLEKGLEQGIRALVESCQEFLASEEVTLAKLQEKFELSEEDAKEMLARYWK